MATLSKGFSKNVLAAIRQELGTIGFEKREVGIFAIKVGADVLGTVHLPLFQGDSSDVGQNEYLCSAIVEDRSLWDRGRVKIRLSFDEHCVMSVEAVNAKTGRALQVTLDRSRAVDDVLRDLGLVQGAVPEPQLKLPESGLGKALGRLFKLFGR